MSSVLRSAAVFAFVSAIGIVSVPGCSQQGEGERCDSAKNGDADCDSGLSCVKEAELSDHVTDRCCPAEGTESDTRCTRGTAVSMGGSGGTGGGAPTSGAGGTAAAGEPSGGTPGASGTPTSSDGGMTSGGAPAVADGGAADAPSTVAGAPSAGGAGGAP
jgi:hypothetical protein